MAMPATGVIGVTAEKRAMGGWPRNWPAAAAAAALPLLMRLLMRMVMRMVIPKACRGTSVFNHDACIMHNQR